MRPNQIAAGIAAVSLLAGPLLSGAASASVGVSHIAARGHLSSAQLASLHAKMLPFAGYARATQPVKIMVHLPLRDKAGAIALAAQMSNPRSSLYHKFLTRQQFEQRFGPTAADRASAAAALRAAGFTVSKIDSQNVTAQGTAAVVERTFSTRMGLVRDGATLHVDARTPVAMPAALKKLNAIVIGLNAMPRYHPDNALAGRTMPFAKSFAASLKHTAGKPHTNAYYGPLGPYFPGELYQAYGQPAQNFSNGTGETIGIVGYGDTLDSDNQESWCYYGLGQGCGGSGGTLAPFPVVNHIIFAGSIPPNSETYAGISLEANLDVQMAGGSSPGATIDQYAADGVSNFGFLDAYSYIAFNNVDDVVTTSYSECELDYLDGNAPLYMLQALDDVFVQGTTEGITWLFSSGDNGAYGCTYEGDNVDLATSSLASDPNVTAVGGTTTLNTTFFDDGFGTGYGTETSYSSPDFDGGWGSGGGVSQLFTTPSYQTAIGLDPGTISELYGAPYGSGRQTPDISLQMGGPASGPFSAVWVYSGLYPDEFIGLIGTSASSPELAGNLAGALAAANVLTGNAIGPRLGSANNLFYLIQYLGYGPVAFNQYIPGDNLYTFYRPGTPGSSFGTAGYNQVVGLGTPNTSGILSLTAVGPGYQFAGDTYTASNP